MQVSALGLLGGDAAIHPPPCAHQSLDVRGRVSTVRMGVRAANASRGGADHSMAAERFSSVRTTHVRKHPEAGLDNSGGLSWNLSSEITNELEILRVDASRLLARPA